MRILEAWKIKRLMKESQILNKRIDKNSKKVLMLLLKNRDFNPDEVFEEREWQKKIIKDMFFKEYAKFAEELWCDSITGFRYNYQGVDQINIDIFANREIINSIEDIEYKIVSKKEGIIAKGFNLKRMIKKFQKWLKEKGTWAIG